MCVIIFDGCLLTYFVFYSHCGSFFRPRIATPLIGMCQLRSW